MKRRRESASSLELLLDTICNTFGGVLFLAILVCVMLRSAPRLKTLAANPSAESVATQSRLAAISGERDVLQASLRQQARLQERFSDAATEEAWHERETLNARLASTLRARDDALRAMAAIEQANAAAELAETKKESAAAAVDAAEAKRELATATTDATEARRALAAEIAARTQVARLPCERSTNKREIGLVVRFGRLYEWIKRDMQELRVRLNTDEFVVVEERDDEIVTIPKPYAGVPITTEQTPNLRAKLAELDPRSQYVAVVVWSDSFAQFLQLKSLLVERGLEYRLMPLAEGDPIFSQGGRGGKVQ